MYIAGGTYVVCNMSHIHYCLLNVEKGHTITPNIDIIDSWSTIYVLATRQYNGPLTQEEIDELLKQLQNKVDEVSQMEFDFSNDDDDCYPPVINNWYTEDEVVSCSHTWKQVVLLNSTVYDCSKCGAKKESI